MANSLSSFFISRGNIHLASCPLDWGTRLIFGVNYNLSWNPTAYVVNFV